MVLPVINAKEASETFTMTRNYKITFFYKKTLQFWRKSREEERIIEYSFETREDVLMIFIEEGVPPHIANNILYRMDWQYGWKGKSLQETIIRLKK
jgi:hypothetical protein